MRTAAYVPDDDQTQHHRPGEGVSGDERAFEQEISGCREALYRTALRLTGNRADAEDLLQETLTRAYVRREQLAAGGSAPEWLQRMMAISFVTSCRGHRPEPARGLNPELGPARSATGSRGQHGPARHGTARSTRPTSRGTPITTWPS